MYVFIFTLYLHFYVCVNTWLSKVVSKIGPPSTEGPVHRSFGMLLLGRTTRCWRSPTRIYTYLHACMWIHGCFHWFISEDIFVERIWHTFRQILRGVRQHHPTKHPGKLTWNLKEAPRGKGTKNTNHQLPWAPKTMKNKGFGHIKTRLFTIKTSKNVGFGAPWCWVPCSSSGV